VHRHVHVAAHRAFFHLGVAGTNREQDGAQFRHILLGLFAGANVGSRHDLDERHSGAVEVDQRIITTRDATLCPTEVGRLAGVFFQMCALDADAHVARQHEEPIDVQRLVVLTHLIGLRQVWVEVVLAVERARLHPTVECQPEPHRQLDRMTVEHRQRTRQAEGHGVDVRVGFVAETIRARAEQFGFCREFDVHFETDDEFPTVDELLGGRHHRRRVSGVHDARSLWLAFTTHARVRQPRGTSSLRPMPARAPAHRRAGPHRRCRTARSLQRDQPSW